jgi:hypothetical protein
MSMTINGAEIKHMRLLIYFALKEAAAPFQKIAAGTAAPGRAGIPILLASLAVKMLKSDEKPA